MGRLPRRRKSGVWRPSLSSAPRERWMIDGTRDPRRGQDVYIQTVCGSWEIALKPNPSPVTGMRILHRGPGVPGLECPNPGGSGILIDHLCLIVLVHEMDACRQGCLCPPPAFRPGLFNSSLISVCIWDAGQHDGGMKGGGYYLAPSLCMLSHHRRRVLLSRNCEFLPAPIPVLSLCCGSHNRYQHSVQ